MKTVLFFSLFACSTLAAYVEPTGPYYTPYVSTQGYHNYPAQSKYEYRYQPQYPLGGYQKQQYPYGGPQQQYPYERFQQQYPLVESQQQYPSGGYQDQYPYSQLNQQYLSVPTQALQVLVKIEQRLYHIQQQLERYQQVYPQQQWQQYVQAVIKYLNQVKELQAIFQNYVQNNEVIPSEYQGQVIQLYNQIYSLYQRVEDVYQNQGNYSYQQDSQYPSTFQKNFPDYQGQYQQRYEYQQEVPFRSAFGIISHPWNTYKDYSFEKYQPYQKVAVKIA